MNYFLYFFVFFLGAIIGSFLNVVVLRLNTGKSIVSERSQCFSCGKTLRWFELIPIFSFLLQKARCRKCKSKISWQYISVEILTGMVFLLIFNFQWPIFNQLSIIEIFKIIYFWTIFSILIALSVYDLRHKIIPDILVYSFIILSFLGSLFLEIGSPAGELIENWPLQIGVLFSGFVIAAPFFFLWFLSRGRWMGFGDVKLALGIGFFLGLIDGIYALLWAFWIGGAVSLVFLLMGHLSSFSKSGKSSLFSPLQKLTIKSEIPFGPFLVLGLAVAFFFNWDFLNLEIIFSLI